MLIKIFYTNCKQKTLEKSGKNWQLLKYKIKYGIWRDNLVFGGFISLWLLIL